MNYAGRMNAFIFKGQTVYDALKAYRKMQGMTHVELNYPEHVEGYDIEKIRDEMGDLKLNGLAVRWRHDFSNGDFTNPDETLRARAVQMVRDAVDVCRNLGGSVITLWFENDGFDYAFQMDYEKCFCQIVDTLQMLADEAPDMKFSIEYKPFEERNYPLVDSTGMVLYLLRCVNRPNVGCTFDFCHMLMKNDAPSYGLALAAKEGKLFGLHMNDGYARQDGGMIFGSVNIPQAAEFIYYLKKYHYDGTVFFDTFPVRENPVRETQSNIDSFNKILSGVEALGMDRIQSVIDARDGVRAHQLVMDMLR